MLALEADWSWDFWLADDGHDYHCFYLHAPRSLGDPVKRHRAARIGHAISHDLRSWRVLGDPITTGPSGSFDDTATWTGCTVRGDDGMWRMFYTGSRFLDPDPSHRNIETVGVATSADLITWEKQAGPVTQADPRWYETLGTSEWGEEAWRDPWVFKDPSGNGWHMLVTARANHGSLLDRGVIGHATSVDLTTWDVQPPLSEPGAGFGHLEVPQVERIGNSWTLLFSCTRNTLSPTHPEKATDPGTWTLPISGPLGPFDLTDARPLTTSRLYAGRAVRERTGDWGLLAFHNSPEEEPFTGGTSDPMPIHIGRDGRLWVHT